MFIDSVTKRRVNIQAPYKDFSRLDTQEVRELAGVVEIPDPVDPEDYSSLTHYKQEIDDAPYVVYTLKSQQQIVQSLNALARSTRTAAYLNETDPLFFKEQRGDVPPGTWVAAVTAVKLRYPKLEVPDGEQSVIPDGA